MAIGGEGTGSWWVKGLELVKEQPAWLLSAIAAALSSRAIAVASLPAFCNLDTAILFVVRPDFLSVADQSQPAAHAHPAHSG